MTMLAEAHVEVRGTRYVVLTELGLDFRLPAADTGPWQHRGDVRDRAAKACVNVRACKGLVLRILGLWRQDGGSFLRPSSPCSATSPVPLTAPATSAEGGSSRPRAAPLNQVKYCTSATQRHLHPTRPFRDRGEIDRAPLPILFHLRLNPPHSSFFSLVSVFFVFIFFMVCQEGEDSRTTLARSPS